MGRLTDVERRNRVTITSASPESCGVECRMANGAGTQWVSAAWPVANVAFYVPFLVFQPFTAKTMHIFNGATASGNVDVGIYNDQGTRLVSSGSTAQSGTTAIQSFDITDTLLLPGMYYMAVAMNGTTGTMRRAQIQKQALAGAGCYQQATAFALPATATFAHYANDYFPNLAVSSRTLA